MKKMMTGIATASGLLALLAAPSTGAAESRAAATGAKPAASAARTKAEGPRIDVMFVLDTTGSMGGLIEGAKLKIWSIANQMIAARPQPRLRIGLVAYRDRGDQYVTRFFDLTEDIDAVYARLQGFRADGGGDSPESVNQALDEAVRRPAWDESRDVLKVIFLVGDFPPHMDYADDVKYPLSCQRAARRDIIVNTVQCGNESTTVEAWREIARLAEGTYMSIGQTGDMTVTGTPMDAELAKLNKELGSTIVAYGSAAAVEEARARQARSEAAPAPVAAERLAFKARASVAERSAMLEGGVAAGVVGGVVGRVEGGGDLVDDEQAGRARLETLDKDRLPAEMKGLSLERQRAYLAGRRVERDALQRRIAELVKQRETHLEAERKKAAATRRDAFDARVSETIRAQAARKGIHYEDAAPAKP